MASRKLKKFYLNFIVKSLLQEPEKWEYKYEDGYYSSTNHYRIEYPDVQITINNTAWVDKISVYSKKNSDVFYMMNIFSFIFRRNLRLAFKYMKRTKQVNEIKSTDEHFMNILPLNEVRRQKLKDLLEI